MWKQQAQELYIKGEKINVIARAVGVSRRTLSDYFKSLPVEIQNKRNDVKKQLRRQYQRNWDRTERVKGIDICYEIVKRQHNIDVAVLSAERHF